MILIKKNSFIAKRLWLIITIVIGIQTTILLDARSETSSLLDGVVMGNSPPEALNCDNYVEEQIDNRSSNFNKNSISQTVSNNCKFIKNKCSNSRQGWYGYPEIKWRQIGEPSGIDQKIKTVTNKMRQWETGEASPPEWFNCVKKNKDLYRIILNGDVAAAISYLNRTGGSSRINSVRKEKYSTPPVIIGLYSQYNGRLEVHALKTQRVGAYKSLLLHAKISPHHLQFLKGEKKYISAGDANCLAPNPLDASFRSGDNFSFFNLTPNWANAVIGIIGERLGADVAILFAPEEFINSNYFDSGEDKLFTYDGDVIAKWYLGVLNSDGSHGNNEGWESRVCLKTSSNSCDAKHIIEPYFSFHELEKSNAANNKYYEFIRNLNVTGSTLTVSNSDIMHESSFSNAITISNSELMLPVIEIINNKYVSSMLKDTNWERRELGSVVNFGELDEWGTEVTIFKGDIRSNTEGEESIGYMNDFNKQKNSLPNASQRELYNNILNNSFDNLYQTIMQDLDVTGDLTGNTKQILEKIHQLRPSAGHFIPLNNHSATAYLASRLKNTCSTTPAGE